MSLANHETKPEHHAAGEDLFNHVKSYLTTVYELYKLKAVDSLSSASATAIMYLLITIVSIFALTLLNIGIALWISAALNSTYSGFFILGGFYVLIGLIVLMAKKSIKRSVADKIINGTLND